MSHGSWIPSVRTADSMQPHSTKEKSRTYLLKVKNLLACMPSKSCVAAFLYSEYFMGGSHSGVHPSLGAKPVPRLKRLLLRVLTAAVSFL